MKESVFHVVLVLALWGLLCSIISATQVTIACMPDPIPINYKKIHIFGGSGSGKTTFAKKLSILLSIPHYDLDDFFWNPAANRYVKMPIAAREKGLDRVLNQSAWIIEGVYYTWPSRSFELSEVIVFLEVPLWLRQIRIVKRYLQHKWQYGKNSRHTLKVTRTIFKENLLFEKNKKEIDALLFKSGTKIIRCRSFNHLMGYVAKRRV